MGPLDAAWPASRRRSDASNKTNDAKKAWADNVFLMTLRDHSRLQRATVKRAKLELAAKQVNPAAAAIGVPGRNITGVNDMETINAGNGLSIYLPLALYLVVAIVGWRLMKRRRRSKAERATYWQTCYIKLNSLAKSHRRQAAEFEIQAEKFRLRWQQEQRALQKRRFDEMFFKK